MNKINFKHIRLGRPSAGRVIFWVIATGAAVFVFFFVRGLVTCWTITPLPGMTPSTCGTISGNGLTEPTINEQGTPIAPVADLPPAVSFPESNLPPALGWSQPYYSSAHRSRLPRLYRQRRTAPLRYDDPAHHRPVDQDSRNALDPARHVGEYSRLRIRKNQHGVFLWSREQPPGRRTRAGKKDGRAVHRGADIQYYAQIDFNTFVEFVDLIGGIDIYNDEKLKLDLVGSGKDKKPLHVAACGI